MPKASTTHLDRLFKIAGDLVARHRVSQLNPDYNAVLRDLRRRVKAVDEQDARTAVNRAARLYDAAVTVAAQNEAALWPAVKDGLALEMPGTLREEMLDKMRLLAPGEFDAEYEDILGYVFYVWHIR